MRLFDSFRDRAVQRVARFGLPVTIGKAVTSLSSVITLALLAHHLGPAELGVVALIRTVVTIVDQYANCNTWQAVVKYGADAMAVDQPRDVERVIKLAVVIDVATAVLAAIVIAVLAFVVPTLLSWNAHDGVLCALYSITLVTRVPGASDGIFRICDAYRAQAIVTSIGAAAMTIAIAVAVALDASLDGCMIALIAGEVISNLLVTMASFYVASRGGLGGWLTSSLAGIRTTFPGITRFLISTNAQLTVKKTQTELDMVVVGSMLGTAAAGLFRVVKQLGTIPGRVFMPFEQVLFTELARAASAGDYAGFARLLARSAGIATVGSLAIWAIAAAAAGPIIRLVAGNAFIAAAAPFRWYLLAMVLNVANAPVQRAMVALGRPGTLFWFDLGALAVLVITMLAFVSVWGVVGVALAMLLHKVMQTGWSTWLVARIIRQRQSTV